ncbi:MAG: TonB-dependent receptor [Candidatus Acidiferrales bacterium]
MTARILIVCFLVSVLLFTWRPANALEIPAGPATISGTVLGPERKPIPRATVRLLDSTSTEQARALTDTQGRFRFAGLVDSAYTLAAELVGFETLTQRARPGEEIELQLSLAPVREQVVVTATRTEAPSGQLGAATSVLFESELEQRRILPVSEALRALPGATVARTGGYGASTSLFIRGGESDYNKVYLDGIPLNEAGGAYEWSVLTADNFERVEVVRGPQSALFGSDAMAGAVQLFTRRGPAESARPRITLGGEGGNRDTWRAHAGLTGAGGPFDYSLSWARFSTDNREPNSAFHNTSLSANVGAALSERTSVRAVLRGELGRVGTPGQTAFGRPDLDAFLRRRDASAGLALHDQTAAFWEQRLRYSFAQSRQLSRNLIADPFFVPRFEDRAAQCFDFTTGVVDDCEFFDFPFDFLNHLRRHQLSYQSDWRAGAAGGRAGLHVFTFAFEWDREQGFLGDRLAPGGEVNARRDNFGWVFQHQAVWGRFFMTNGVRVEDNESFGASVIPRTSLAYYLRRGGGAIGPSKLKFNFGLGIKEPSLLESFSLGPFAFGNPDLRPERARSFDFGIEQRFGRDRAKLEANWFDNRFRDLIAFEITSFVPFTGSFFNIGRSQAKGSELILEVAPGGGLRARGHYTFLDSQVTESATVFDPVFEEGNRLFRRPKHSGALQVFWDWRRVSLSSTTLFVGRRTDTDFALLGLTSSKGYTRWEVSAAYQSPHRVTYFAVVENLLNRDYMEVLGFPALKLMFRAGGRVSY